jgi:hypothetical protein
MSYKSDPPFQSLQIQTSTSKFIVNTAIEHEGNFEHALGTIVGQVNMFLASVQAMIFRISVGDLSRNPVIVQIGIFQWTPILKQEQVIFWRAWCTMSGLRTDIEIINLPPKCRHVEGLGFSGLVESW